MAKSSRDHHRVSLGAFARRMLTPAQMVKAGVFFLADDGPAVVSVLARLRTCQIERGATELKDYLAPYFPDQFREVYRQLRSQYEWLAQRWQLTGATRLDRDQQVVPTIDEMRPLGEALEILTRKIEALGQRRKKLEARQGELEHFEEYVRALAELGLDVQALAELRFLHLRFGMVPRENLDRLRTSAQLGDDMVLELGTRGDRAHVLVVGAGGITPDLDGLLAKAHFEPLRTERAVFAGSSDAVRQELAEEEATIRSELDDARSEEDDLRREHQTLVQDAGQVVARATVFAECDGAMEGRLPVAFLSGWVVREQLPELEAALRREVPNPVALVHEPAASKDDPHPARSRCRRYFSRPPASSRSMAHRATTRSTRRWCSR
jgi:vacuolar-type H+-ATPase subunit I/STV1